MKAAFRISASLIAHIKVDLHRPHPFARERVGFIHCHAGTLPGNAIAIMAAEYRPVDDGDYIDDPTVGAMMGTSAISKALAASYKLGSSVFHIHLHDHCGHPRFSGVDLRENSNFMPNFFNVTPTMPHGAIVLSSDLGVGIYWKSKDADQELLDEIVVVGAPMTVIRRHVP